MAAMPVPPVPEPVAEVAPLSQMARVLNTFFAPSKTFTDLRRSASWWVPFLISAIVSVMFIYAVDQKIGFRKAMENQIRLQPKQAERIDALPADQREKVLQQQATIGKVFSYASPAIGLLYYLIIASVLFGTFKFVTGADLRFKTMFALVVFAWLPVLFVYLLGIVSLLAGVNSDGFLMQNPAATNLGILVDPVSSKLLYSLLSSLDVFTFWSMALMAIGVTCISKVKRGTAFAVVFGWFGFWVLVKIGLAAVFS
jgi:hypothetical protein